MGVEKKIDLSNAGQLLVDMLKLVESLVPGVVIELEPDYAKKDPAEQKAIEERARNIVTKVLSGLMMP